MGTLCLLGCSTDANVLISGGADGAIRFWQIDSGQLVTTRQVGRPQDWITDMIALSDTSLMATACGKRVNIWRQSDQVLACDVEMDQPIVRLIYHAGLNRLAVCMRNTIREYCVQGDGSLRPHSESQLSRAIVSAAWSPDGAWIASGTQEGGFLLSSTTHERAAFVNVPQFYSKKCTGMAFSSSSNGSQRLVCTGTSNCVVAWGLLTEAERLEPICRGFSFGYDDQEQQNQKKQEQEQQDSSVTVVTSSGNVFAIGDDRGRISVCKFEEGGNGVELALLVIKQPEQQEDQTPVEVLCWSADGGLLCVGHASGCVSLFRLL